MPPSDHGKTTTLGWQPGQRRAAIWSALMALAVLSPIRENFQTPRHDDFPLSYYPMFSVPRPEIETIPYIVGVDDSGKRSALHHKYWGTGGMNQARSQLVKMVRRKATCPKVCQAAAKRVARHRSDIASIEIVRGRFDPLRYFGEDKREPLAEELKCRCEVSR